jgi:peroxiredoxin 2/4
MPLLIGKHFEDNHDFVAPAIMPDGRIEQNFSLSQYVRGSYALVFFYSMNFGFVCPTELLALSNRKQAFASRGVKPVVVSCDSYLSHIEWRNKPLELGGIGDFPFPLVADTSRGIARGYDCLVNESMALRGSFVVDRDGCFRYQMVQDFPIGRNIDELLRVIDGLQSYQKTGKLCPAGWSSGEETLTALPEALADYMVRNAANL